MGNWQQVGALVAALVAAVVTITLGEWIAHRIASGDALFAVVPVIYGLAAAVATLVAQRMAPGARWPAIAVVAVLAFAAVSNQFLAPHPLWFGPLALAAIGAGWVAARRRA